uniref:Uncharacterized protein n=1 Tax=Solanum lycopersicum TaxID=4081 RepID=A0A3Q7IMU4_SOLLC
MSFFPIFSHPPTGISLLPFCEISFKDPFSEQNGIFEVRFDVEFNVLSDDFIKQIWYFRINKTLSKPCIFG